MSGLYLYWIIIHIYILSHVMLFVRLIPHIYKKMMYVLVLHILYLYIAIMVVYNLYLFIDNISIFILSYIPGNLSYTLWYDMFILFFFCISLSIFITHFPISFIYYKYYFPIMMQKNDHFQSYFQSKSDVYHFLNDYPFISAQVSISHENRCILFVWPEMQHTSFTLFIIFIIVVRIKPQFIQIIKKIIFKIIIMITFFRIPFVIKSNIL